VTTGRGRHAKCKNHEAHVPNHAKRPPREFATKTRLDCQSLAGPVP
jgi:hypothetical protein